MPILSRYVPGAVAGDTRMVLLAAALGSGKFT
jgi:hypothetical protein